MMKNKLKNNSRLFLYFFLVILILLVLFIVLKGNLIPKNKIGVNIGDKAPDFSLMGNHGNKVSLRDFEGKKAVVINFWATWCGPCREEMPLFEKIYERNKDEVEILGINLQESERAISNFLKAYPVTYKLLLDPNEDAKKKYNIFMQPVTYFIDENGIIADKKFGPLTEKEMEGKFGKIILIE